MTWAHHRISASEVSVEIDGIIIGYIKERLLNTPSQNHVVYSIRRNKTEEWRGAYMASGHARQGLVLALREIEKVKAAVRDLRAKFPEWKIEVGV